MHNKGLLRSIYDSGLWRVYPFLLVYSIGFAIIFPITPSLVTNGFASLAAGSPRNCELFTPESSPKECVDAHGQAVTWSSWASFVEGCILSFIFSPVIGRLSDIHGRKPFMLVGVALQLIPIFTLLLYVNSSVDIRWYYPANVLSSMVSAFSMCLVAVADTLEQRHRTTATGFLLCCFSLGLIVGPSLGGMLSPHSALTACLATLSLTLLYVATCVQETAPMVRPRAAGAACGASSLPADCPKDTGDTDGPTGLPGDLVLDLATVPELTAPLLHHHAPHSVPPPHTQYGTGCTGCDMEAAVAPGRDMGNNTAGMQLADQVSPMGVTSSRSPAAESAPQDMEAGVPHKRTEQPSSSRREGTVEGGARGGWLAGLDVVLSSRFYVLLALLWVTLSAALNGAQGLFMQYLQLSLGFNTQDQARFLTIAASAGLAVKLGLLPLLVPCLGDKAVLILSLLAFVVEDVLVALSTTKAMVFGAVTIGSLSSMAYPTLMSLQSSRARPDQQGAVNGALNGISSIASGLGPLGFAYLFDTYSKRDSPTHPYMPEVVWYVAAGLAALSALTALLLPGGRTHHSNTAASGAGAASEEEEPLVPAR